MASAVGTNVLRTIAKRQMFDFDPDATTVTAVSWQPMAGFNRFMAGFFRTVGTSNVTFEIAAATDSSGTGATQVKAHAVGSQPDAVGDQLYLEVSAAQVRQVLAGATHVSARISVGTGTDEGVVYYEFGQPTFHADELTDDIVA